MLFIPETMFSSIPLFMTNETPGREAFLSMHMEIVQRNRFLLKKLTASQVL